MPSFFYAFFTLENLKIYLPYNFYNKNNKNISEVLIYTLINNYNLTIKFINTKLKPYNYQTWR